MKRIILFIFLLNCLLPTAYSQLYKKVNPFIGTGGHGHTFPGPTMPFGACQLSPDTRLEGWDGCSGYHESDSVIYGFSHTHLSGTGCSDYGDILLMPVTKRMMLDKYQYASKFSHNKEKAHAGYYQVFLNDPKVNVELTSTLHGGIHRYTFQKNDEQFVVLDLKHRDEVLDSKMEKVDDYTLRGYRFSKAWAKNQKVFFEIKFSKKIEEIQYEELKTGSNTSVVRLDKSLHCIIKFANNSSLTTNNLQLITKVAISGVDDEGAHNNLIAEMPDANWNFDSYLTKAEQTWEKELSKIQIDNEGMRKFENLKMSDSLNSQILKFSNSQIVFYTALYHCMIHPSLYNDVDGRYRGRDDNIHNTEGKFDYYTVFSLWDTYRALHPLLTILDKKRTNDFINTFIKQYEQCGRLPIWELSSNETNCMIGYHVVSVIWDAYNKGIRDYDAELAFKAMKSIATHYSDYDTIYNSPNPNYFSTNGTPFELKLKESAREKAADADALESYIKYGYVRSDDSHESVSKTLEYAYDDWCIAQMAKALGKKKDYDYYKERSHYWMNVYDPTTGFMRARKNGCLYEPFSPYTVDNNYTEANAWQYSFYVPHDWEWYLTLDKEIVDKESLLKANAKTTGREQADISGLIGQYAHGNEPSHHILFLDKNKGIVDYDTIITKIVDSFYLNSPNGIIGNEDCGQMSAWYVFATIGFYPYCPGNNKFAYIKPSFKNIRINTKDVNIDIETPTIDTSKYHSFLGFTENIDSLNYNKKLNYHIKYKLYSNGLGCFASFGTTYNGYKPVAPYILQNTRVFNDSMKIKFKSLDLKLNKKILKKYNSHLYSKKEKDKWNNYYSKKYSIIYTINNSVPKIYDYPFFIYDNSKINFYLVDNYKKDSSSIQTATFTKLPTDRKIILNNTYNPSYSAGGAEGLMDGIYGKLNWRAGDWQGYQGQDIEIIMAFDEARSIKKLAANFLEDQNSWIFYPKEVSFYVSEDSVNWTLVESIPTNKSEHDEKTTISKFESKIYNIKKQTYKYAKVVAKNFGPMPQWHEGRGNPTFIFIDEFEVE